MHFCLFAVRGSHCWIVDDCWIGVGMVVDQNVESLACQIPDHIQEPGVHTIVGDVVVAYPTDAVREGWCHL